jgi:peptidoglycan-N-acetylglucosamine deacetylase
MSTSSEPKSERSPPLEPWEWPEAHWRGLVDQVRAGRALRPPSWPGGARCAFALSFDSDHETSDLKDGGQSIGRMSWGQYGNRVAVPRILKLLQKHDVKASFYVPAVVALLHPDEQRRVIAEGHEIGIHGWIHELNSTLPGPAERDLILRSADTLEKVTGRRAVGQRTPSWDFSPITLRIAMELGLLYDSSLFADEDCYELLLEGKPSGVVELPVEWVRDDAVYLMMNYGKGLRPFMPPNDVLDIFRRELDAAWEDGGIFQLTCHPHVIGYRSRIWILEELIRHAKAKPRSPSGDAASVWFATHEQVVRWAKNNAA